MPAISPRFNQLKLDMSPPSMQPWKMTPPTLSPLHMTPPNCELPNFSPPTFPLPYLSAFDYFPPAAIYEEILPQGPTVMAFSREDPTLLVIGTSETGTPERPAGGGSVMLYMVYDVEREVKGDIFPPDPARKKIRPEMQHLKTIQTSGAVFDVKFNPHEGMRNLVYASTSDGKILVYEIRTRSNGKKTLRLMSTQNLFPERGPHQIRKIAFSPTDEFILAVACSSYASIALLNFEDGVDDDDAFDVVAEFKASNRGIVRTVAFSNDGTSIYTGGDDGGLREWNITNPSNPTLSWQDTKSHDGEPITCIVPWPDPYGADYNAKRRAILTGSYEGVFRHFDLSHHMRPPPMKEEHRLEEERERAGEAGGAICSMTPLPPLPVLQKRYEADDEFTLGVYSPESTDMKSRPLDSEEVGLVVCSASGMTRLLVQRQNFHQVFIEPPTDEEFDEMFKSPDGVKLDWEGREREFTWYTVVVFKEHFEKNDGVAGPRGGGVYAGTAVALVDWDPMYKDSGKQRKRRGWRVVSASYGDRRVLMFQGYCD